MGTVQPVIFAALYFANYTDITPSRK